MKIHLLVFSNLNNVDSSFVKSVNLLIDSAAKMGHQVELITAKDCKMMFNGKPRLLINNQDIAKNIKILLVKASFSGKNLQCNADLVKQFELVGVRTINNYAAISCSKDKIAMLQTLGKAKVPTPKTYIVRSVDYINEVAKEIGSYPVILKSVSGSQGIGVSIVESQRGLRSIVDMLIENNEGMPLIIQQYIKESSGKDIRIFVVGGKIITAMERIATKRGEFRSNFSLGGRVKIAELSEEEKKVALKATKACGLDFAGVDLVRTKEGPKILEVNCNPGLEGITQATGLDVAGKMIEHIVKLKNS